MPKVFHGHSRDLQHHPWVLIILMNIKVNKAAVHQCKVCTCAHIITFYFLVRISHGRLKNNDRLFLTFGNSWPMEQPLWGRRARVAQL